VPTGGAQANYDAAVAARPGERAIADGAGAGRGARGTVLERRLDKMVLRAPADGVVSVIAAEVGENVRAGQPILNGRGAASNGSRSRCAKTISTVSRWEKNGERDAERTDGATKAVITELRPLGVFATWQAERVIGDHDRNTLRFAPRPQERRQALSQVPTGLIKH